MVQGAWKSCQCLCLDRDHHHCLFPEAVNVSLWDDSGDGSSPLVPALQGSDPWPWAEGHCGHSVVWALPTVPAAVPWQPPLCPVLLGCSRSELSPLISAASLHIRNAEEPGKDGVIQVHPVVSHLKYSHWSSAVTASASGLPHPCHWAVLELPEGSCWPAGPSGGQ